MKKTGIFLLAFLLFSLFSTILIKAQDTPPLPQEVEKIQDVGKKLTGIGKNLTDEEIRSKYISEELQKILLKNKVVASLDSFFTKNTIFFRIFFGQHYSLSLTLILVIILWLFFALGIGDVTKKGLGLFEGISYILGIIIAIILAQIQILGWVASFLVRLIFSPEAAWARFVVLFIVIGILVILFYFKGALSQYLEQIVKKRKEGETEQKQKEIKKFTKGLEKGAGI